MSDCILGTFGLSLQTEQFLWPAPEIYQIFCNEGIDKEKKNIHVLIITTSKSSFMLRHDRMVTSKETTLTMHSRDCQYMLYHITPKLA